MAESQVIARKFRPKKFGEVIGQEAITKTLSNSISANRVHHAYLFTGARGVGKTTTARILAKALNCVTGPTNDPCDSCPSCMDIAASRSIDVLEIDAASHTGVENVRELIINTISISPAQARYKIFIIDEVHQLSGHAFNALLKTLEEPPSHAIFILATTELHKVPETILSRCQVFEFRTITLKRIFDQLRSIADSLGVKIGDSALLAVARAGEGSMRDAESALDQVISFAGSEVADEDVPAALGLADTETLHTTIQAIADQDGKRVLEMVDQVVSRGYDIRNFCRELLVEFRSLLVVKIAGLDYDLLQIPQGAEDRLGELADWFSEQDLIRFFSILTKTEQDIRLSPQPRFQLEIGLMKLVHSRRLYSLEEALNRIADIQSRLGSAPQIYAKPSSGRKVDGEGEDFGGGGSARESLYDSRRSDRARGPASDTPSRSSTAVARARTPLTEADGLANSPSAPTGDRPSGVQRMTLSASGPSREDTSPEFVESLSAESLPAAIQEDSKGSQDSSGLVDRIKNALADKTRMTLLVALDEAESIEIEGNVVRVCFPPSAKRFQSRVESVENRKTLEETCAEILGRPVKVSVMASSLHKLMSDPAPKSEPAPGLDAQEKARRDPAVQAVVETFHGEILDVIEPEN